MYDKFGCVLRVETVINDPKEFRVRRQGIRQGAEVVGWFPMAKRVSNRRRYAAIGRAANARYLTALSAATDPSRARLNRSPRLLRAHGLIAKIPHSRRWRVTAVGVTRMSALLHLQTQPLPLSTLPKAA